MPTFNDLYGKPVPDDSDEPFIYHGEELTDERSQKVADETLAEVRRRNLVPGRKSLDGEQGTMSPTLQFRVPRELKERFDARAKAEGVSPAKLGRRAVEEFLARDAR